MLIAQGLLFPLFLFSSGRSFPYNLFSFLANDPKLVIPNLPKTSGACYLYGMLSQLPFCPEETPLNLSTYLSHEMHFNGFLVNNASF